MLERGLQYMLQAANTALIILGSLLMVYNIIGFIRFVRRFRGLQSWSANNLILDIPVVLLILFLIGYLAVGLFGKPDLIMALILFFGSVFVFIMYRLILSITDRILANEQMEARLLAAQEAESVKAAFLASMSHEMRTPMNVILGITDLALKEPQLPEKTRQQLEKIDQSGQQLLGLINHILELNSIAAGEITLLRESFSPAAFLEQVDSITRPLCEDKGLRYCFEAPSALPACCEGDATQLKTVLLGLLSNAVKYTDAPGEVRLTVDCEQEEAGLVRLRFTVADTGIGMSEEFLTRVFEPFTQEDESFTNRFGGGGLSLAVSKKLADAMGGSLQVQSEKGKGSVFTLTVPLTVLEAPVCEAPEEEITLAGRRVLVVEDVPENAEIVQDLLELEGIASDHAENGLAALEMFESARPGTYDAILMDLRMPVMDGLEAARRIRALSCPDAAAIPIIALTANAFPSDVEASRAAGMNAHLAKPADADALYDTLRNLISISQKQKGAVRLD